MFSFTLPRRLTDGGRRAFETGTAARPYREPGLTDVIALIQLASAGLALILVLLPGLGSVHAAGMLAVALFAIVLGVALLSLHGRVDARWWMPIELLSTLLLAGYVYFGGRAGIPFGLFYLVLAVVSGWFLSAYQAVAQAAIMAAAYALALALTDVRDTSAGPARGVHALLVGICALTVTTLIVRALRRRVVDDTEQLAALVEGSEDAIVGKDLDGVVTVWNHGAECLFGFSAAEALGRSVTELVPPAREGEDAELMRRALSGERIESHTTERRVKDGSLVSISATISPIRDGNGRIVGTVSIARNLTLARHAAHRIALQSELLDAVDAAVIVTDFAACVTYWNRGAERLYGYAAEEAIGRDLLELIVPDEAREAVGALAREAISGRPASAELDLHDRDGRSFPVDFRLLTFVPAAGDRRPGALIGISVDISARREAEESVRQLAEGHEEIAELAWLARRGAELEELQHRAVRTAARVLSADCASLVELGPDSGFVFKAAIGWPEGRAGDQIAPDAGSLAGYVIASHRPIVVDDWDCEERVQRSGKLLARGVRCSVAVLVGEPGSPVGVLAVHYCKPQRAPRDHLPFLDTVANLLAEAIDSRAAKATIQHQAFHDGLTGLPNRALLLEQLRHALDADAGRGHGPAVLLIDLDHFMLVNDSLGHGCGDELLRLVGARLSGVMRKGDLLARLGGDEFAVLCRDLPSEMSTARVAQRLASVLEAPFSLDSEERVLTASIGVALSNGFSSAEELLRDADAAMNHAKQNGRGRTEMFDKEMRARVLGRVRTESALRSALGAEDELFVHYQPLVSLRTGAIVGAEALARWRHPEWGLVPPSEFIAVAEDSGLIHALGARVLRQAAHDSAAWRGFPDFAGIAVNVSTRQLAQPHDLTALVRQVTADEGIAAGFISLEITESLLMEALGSAQHALDLLTELGVQLSLDDFGTGYSSLSYLRALRLDRVKIDRSLTMNIVDAPRDAAVADAIIHMGHALDLDIVGEGIETREQATRLQALGCDVGQGFFFARPLSAEAFAALLHDPPDWLPRPVVRSRARARSAELG
jgi:diguanylate cyclase (GGDEF)-like protein/PAS domain S-box-containing protein